MKVVSKNKKTEFSVFSVLFIFRTVYFFSLDYNFTPDSYEYIAKNGFAWLQGSVDRYRLPVYPMLIDICKFVSEDHFLSLLCIFQLFISLISIVVFYLTVKKLINNVQISLLITFFYGTLNAVSGWDKTILTESLSLSLTTFIIFGIVSYIKEYKLKYIYLTTICFIFGCFLRAVFVIYAGLLFGFLVLLLILPSKSNGFFYNAGTKVLNLKSASIALLPIILVFIYAFAFYNQYGGFTISDSALGQQIYVVLENGYYEDSKDVEIKNIADFILNSQSRSSLEKELTDFINDFYKGSNVDDTDMQQMKNQMLSLVDNKLDESIDELLYDYYFHRFRTKIVLGNITLAKAYIMLTFDRDRIQQFVNESKRNHFKPYIIKMCLNVLNTFESYHINSNTIIGLFSTLADNSVFFIKISLLHVLIVSIIELILFLMIMIKKKKNDWIRLGIGAYILSTLVLSIFGTNAEYPRTAITALPFVFVAIALYTHWFYEYITIRKMVNQNMQHFKSV